MNIISGRKVQLSVWFLVLIVAVLGVVAYVAFALLGSATDGVAKAASGVGKELVQTVLLGVLVGVFVDLYLKHVLKDLPMSMLEKSGITKVYPQRLDAAAAFRQIVNDEKVKELTIAGISLRDFLTTHGELRKEVWKEVLARFQRDAGMPSQSRLRVRLLLLDPSSSEGYFRYKIERPESPEATENIDVALQQIAQVRKQLEPGVLEARLYEHCPFSFIFLTKAQVFVEQYYYGDHAKAITMPLVEYRADTAQYREMRRSVETIWEWASPGRIRPGTAIPLKKALIKNIFRVDNREAQGARQAERIRATRGGTVDILSITGNYYVRANGAAAEALLEASSPARGEDRTTVKFALINPVSQQAIYRAVADDASVEEIRQRLETYNWDEHTYSNLYAKVRKTISEIRKAQAKGHAFELRLYSCSAASSLLITPDAAIVGKYVYGRSKQLQEKSTLKSEFPAIEFETPPPAKSGEDALNWDGCGTEAEIVRCTFEIIWNYYSISYEQYVERDAKQEFIKNLARVREELGLTPAAGAAPVDE